MRRAFTLVLLALALTAGAGHAASSSPVVVSQIYAGGGNTGATYQNDFVELLNRGTTTVDLSGWTVQYATAAGASWSTATLTGTLAAGHYYLVQFASAGAIGAIIPAPDALGTTNLAASGGKVALVHSATALTCGATAGSCAGASGLQDLVGYGTATDFEGAAAPALDATHAAVRDSGGCSDTDSNAADFSAAAPTPRNTSSTAASCSVAPPPAGATASQGVTVDADVQQSLAIALEKPALSFGQVVSGSTPPPLHEHVTVTSNLATGYTLSAHRTAFVPTDLPLGIGVTGPTGAAIPPAFAGGAIVPLAASATTELLLGTTSAVAPAAGDVWDGAIGFSSPIPSVTPGHYSTTVTFTVVGR